MVGEACHHGYNKQVTSSAKNSFIEISLAILIKFSRELKFDIYIKRTEVDYTKIFMAGDTIDFERVNQYKAKGIKYFYVTKDGHDLYCLLVERLGEVISESVGSFTHLEAAELLKELSHISMQEIIFKHNINEKTVKNASNVVNGCINAIARGPSSMLKIMKLISHQPYIMKHSVAVSMFSVLLAKASGMASDTNIEIVGTGGLLHDIGVGQLTFDPEDTKMLTPEQRKEMWRHPELGRQLLDNLKSIRTEVIEIILQHHEQPNGHGYPNGLRGPEIYYPAKIIAIADAFCAMITKRSFRDAFTVEESLAKMKDLPGKFDKNLLEVFTKMLRPK